MIIKCWVVVVKVIQSFVYDNIIVVKVVVKSWAVKISLTKFILKGSVPNLKRLHIWQRKLIIEAIHIYSLVFVFTGFAFIV